MSTGAVEQTRSRLLRDPVVVGVAGVAAATLLHVRDPHVDGAYGYCPFLELTGLPCPGCGGLRAVSALTHGDLVGALSYNLLAVGLVVILIGVWATWTVRRARGAHVRMLVMSDRALVLVLVMALTFGVARNMPWGAGLAP
jgi:hypothetical protein